MKWTGKISITLATVATLFGAAGAPNAKAQAKKPNIVVIMGDDIGMWNIGAYHRGLMAGRTPNLDKLAKEGMLFTDYYAEASCTAGRSQAPPCKPPAKDEDSHAV
jgi:arylsulfatase A-like enzyme